MIIIIVIIFFLLFVFLSFFFFFLSIYHSLCFLPICFFVFEIRSELIKIEFEGIRSARNNRAERSIVIPN